MIRTFTLNVVTVLVLCLPWIAKPVSADDSNAKALKYHSVLLKRPNPGYLFDRFYNTWLDTGTLEELGEFLEQQVESKNRTADRLLLAFFHAKQGDDVKALQQFRTALAKDPGNAATMYQKAIIEARTLDFESAIQDLDAASKSKPGDKLAIAIAKLQGKLYVRNRQLDQALAAWKKLLDANPDDEDLYEDIIELQISEGLYDEAAKLSEKVIAATKDKYKQVILRIRSGDIHQRAGKRSKAVEVYSSTLEDVGGGTWLERELLAQIEQLFRREDDLSGLKEQYQKLLEQYGKRVQVHKQYAKLLSEMGEIDAARKQFEEILKLTPGDRDNRESYVALLAEIGQLADAVKALQAIIAQHPRDGELQLRLAGLHHKAKDKKAAGAAVAKYLGASDKSEYAYLRAAQTLKQFELADEAEQIYAQLTKAYPDSVAALEAQAAFLYDRKKKEDALRIWRALAAGKGRSQLVHVTRILAARHEHEVAFELLIARKAELSDDPIYLEQLVTAAMALKKYQECMSPARRRVQLARTTSDLESAVGQAVQVADKADQIQQLAQELAGVDRRGIQDTCLLAELLERTGDSRQADEVLAAAEDQKSLLVASQQIRLHSLRREWSKAAEATKRLVELPKGRKSIYIRRLVELYQHDFKTDEALRWVQEWKKLSPGSTMPWLTESRLLTQQGKPGEAISRLRAAVQEFDGNEDIRTRLADLYLEGGKLADADRIYWRQYDDSKDLTGKLRAVQKLAEIAELQGNSADLVEKFEERRKSNRTSIEPLLSLAEVHRVGGDYEERRKALVEATRIKVDDLQLLHQIARIEESEDDWERALATLERAAKLDATTRTREKIARLHLHYGNADKGYAILYELAGNMKSDARSVEAIAEAMISVQDWERTVEFLTPQLSAFGDDFRLGYLQAIALEEAGETVAATEVFLKLLRADKEIPGLMATAPQTPWTGWAGNLSSLLPQESIEFMQLSWVGQMVYSHRENSGPSYVTGFRGGGGGQGTVLLPHDAESVRQYSLAHLLSLSQTMDDAEVEDLGRAMRERGVPHAGLLIEVGADMENLQEIASLATDYSQDQAVMALYLMASMSGEGTDAELTAKAYELFKQDRPQLAFIAATQAANSDEAHLKLLDESLKTIDQIKNPNVFTIMSISASLGGGWGRAEPSSLPEKYKQRLMKQLLAWYPKVPNMGQQGSMVFMVVAAALSSSEDPSAYFEFLGQEIVRWRASGQRHQSGMMGLFGGGGGREGFIKPLQFPPATLSNFPPEVHTMLSRGAELDPFGGERESNWSDEAITKALPGIKDPTFKILVAHKFDKPKIVEQTLDGMLKAEQPQLDAFLLAAGKATFDEDYESATQLLDKSRYLPMNREIRKRVDAALVALATDGVGDDGSSTEKPTSPLAGGIKKALAALKFLSAKKSASAPETSSLREIGQQAALRLRRATLDAEERQQLVASLEDLGLSEEAEKLETTMTPSGSTPFSSGNYPSASSQTDRINKLLGDGKQDQAIRAIVSDLNLQARAALSNSGYGSIRRGGSQLAGVIRSHGLTEQVLKEMDPGDSTSLLKISQYGLACEMLNQKDNAKAAYEKALDMKETNDPIRLRLMMLVVDEDVQAAAAHIEKFDRRFFPQFGETVRRKLNMGKVGLRKRFQLVAAVTGHLGNLKDTNRIDLSWVTQLASKLGEGMQQNYGQSLPSLYHPQSKDEEVEGSRAELTQLHRQTHDALCQTMCNIPELAADGFTHLLAAAECEGKVGDDFAKLAQDVLLIQKASQAGSFSGVQYVGSGYGRERERVPFRSPEEFLVRHAWKSNDFATINNNILPALIEAGKKEQAKRLQQDLALYTCEPAGFLEQAKTLFTSQKRSRRSPFPDDGEAMSKIIQIWSERELKIDLEDLIIERVRKIGSSLQYGSEPTFVVDYAVVVAQQDDREKTVAFMERLAAEFLGPKEERKDFIEKHYQSNSVSSGTPNAKIHSFVQLMNGMLQHSKLVFPAVDLLVEVNLTQRAERVNDYFFRRMSSDDDQAVAKCMELLEASPFLSDIDTFRVYVLTDKTLLGAALHQLANSDAEFRRGLREELTARQPQTFGTGLFAAYMGEESSDLASLLNYLATYEKQLHALPEPRQQAIALLVKQLAANVRGSLDLSADADRVYKWFKSRTAQGDQELVQQILAAKRMRDLEIEPQELSNKLGELLPDMIEADYAAAQQLFEKSSELMEDAAKRSTSRFGYGYGGPGEMAARMVREILDESPSVTTFKFALDVSLRQKARLDPIARPYALSQLFNKARKTIAEDEDDRNLKGLQEFYKRLGQAFGAQPTSILAGGYRRIFNNLEPAELKAVVQWCDGQSQSGDYPELARELLAAANMMSALRESKDASKKSDSDSKRPPRFELADYHEYYMAVMRDEELSLNWRILVAASLVEGEHPRTPPEVVFLSADLLRQAIAEKIPTSGQLSSYILLDMVTLDRTEQWRSVATTFTAALRQRNLRASSRSQMSYRYGRGQGNVALLKLNLLLDNEQDVSQILRTFKGELDHDRNAFALVVQYGRTSLAAKMFRVGWEGLARDKADPAIVAFDRQLEEALPAFLETITREDLRYLAEVLLVTIPDTDQESLQPTVENSGRVKRVAARFGQMEFTSPAVKEVALATLCETDEGIDVLADALADASGKIDFAAVVAAEDSNMLVRKQRIMSNWMKHAVTQKDFRKLLAVLEPLSKVTSEEEYYAARALGTIQSSLQQAIAEQWAKWTTEDMVEALPITRQLVRTSGERYYNSGRGQAGMNVLAHVQAGKLNELREWWEALSEEDREFVLERTYWAEMWRMTYRLLEGREKTDLESRIQSVTEMLKAADSVDWLAISGSRVVHKGRRYSQRDLFDTLRSAQMLSSEETLKAGPRIAKAAPVGGLVWAALAKTQQEAGKLEAAAESWQQAVAHAPVDDKQRQTVWRIEQARILKELGRQAEALQVLENFDRDLINEPSAKEFDKLRQELKPQNEAPKKPDTDARKNPVASDSLIAA